MFSDIEGSTRLLAALGPDEYEAALAAHRSIVRAAIAAHSGLEHGTEGDSFFVTFATSADAVAAAVDAQRALAVQTWAPGRPLRVRIGIHAGDVRSTSEDLLGMCIHEAERVKSAAHGGQIVTSALARDLASMGVSGRVRFRSLGRHRLKDLAEPMELFQVCHPDLPDEFPPLRSQTVSPTLPTYRSAFIGREREVARVRELLAGHRLVTLTGIGGCGKTRLALEATRQIDDEFVDGVFFADLGSLPNEDGLTATVANVVGVSFGGGAVGGSTAVNSSVGALVLHLAPRSCLLVLDNCEHILDGVAMLVDGLQASCPRLSVLATSREALLVEGEQTLAVPPLELPRGDLFESEAVSMFVARARESRSTFELTSTNSRTVADICQRLDGIPLAIEFAAARIRHLSPEQILEKLNDRFRLLTGGRHRVQRQQTLEAALDWSHGLLSHHEQVLLRRLAVFPADFGAIDVEEVCVVDPLEQPELTELLGSLVSKSLVELAGDASDVSLRLLETVRVYGAVRLADYGDAEVMGNARLRLDPAPARGNVMGRPSGAVPRGCPGESR